MRAGSAQLPQVGRKPLVLKASEFQHLFEEGPTEIIYAGTPLKGMGQAQQGKVIEKWAREILQATNPETEISDPDLGMCCNGSRRRLSMAAYDFLMGGRRVEIKSARMAWTSTDRRWYVQFFSVKLPYGKRVEPAFDDLYLVILSPRGLHLIQHDLVTGVSTCGKATEVDGHIIQVRGSRHTDCWEDALNKILGKLCQRGGCNVVVEKPFSELDFKEAWSASISPAQEAVAGIPFYAFSTAKRGNRIQEIGFAIDRRLHPHSVFSFAEGPCGKANAPADWVRGKHVVELKSCGLTFDRSQNLWRCCFQSIKPDLFDELWLAIYTSIGIHYYQCKSCEILGFCKAGVATDIHGHFLVFGGPRGELDPLAAFKTIKTKLLSSGCELVAIVEWETGGSMGDGTSFGCRKAAKGAQRTSI